VSGAGLRVRGLTLRRGAVEVLHGIDLALAPGEAVALVGPNAAGKSTLLRALAGLLPLAAGEISFDGRPLAAWPRDALARALALVTAEDPGSTELTVRDRVELGRYPHRGPFRAMTVADRDAVARALTQVGIEALEARPLARLSAGERQLAALARGLAQEPRLLLLDEPAAHLDVGHQLQLFRILDEIRACGVAVLAVVHDLGRAAAWAERLLLLHRGRLAAQGPPDEVLRAPALAEAFGVRVAAHAVAGLGHPLYSFEEP